MKSPGGHPMFIGGAGNRSLRKLGVGALVIWVPPVSLRHIYLAAYYVRQVYHSTGSGYRLIDALESRRFASVDEADRYIDSQLNVAPRTPNVERF